jgi:thiamine-monophosphate kinase
MNEFEFISKFLRPLTNNNPAALNLTDDAAVISSSQNLVITTDTLTENTHFFSNTDPKILAKKLIRVNISDLAAMGAIPKFYLLAATLPSNTSIDWMKQFVLGLAEENQEFNISTLGGDTVKHKGPLVLTITAIGEIPKSQQAITRSKAQIGDDVYVTGTIGDSALGLLIQQNKLKATSTQAQFLISRYNLPSPRINIGNALLGIANSMIDISDGLAQDAEHIANNSEVKLIIHSEKMPLSPSTSQLLQHHSSLLETILSGGDDYELLFTAPPHFAEDIKQIANNTHVNITKIGQVTQGQGVELLDENNNLLKLAQKGYLHL